MSIELSAEDVLPQLLPHDEHNQLLESNVHPRDWKNPSSNQPYHLVVIGAGTAGLVAAAGAAGLGARVALIERDLMGGDCLNVGCVPSKGIIASGRAAAAVRDAHALGVHPPDGTTCDFADAMQRMRKLRAKISPADSAQRFRDLGVDVYFGQGTFVNGNSITVTSGSGEVSTLQYKKAVIATGARAAAPPIAGLDSVRYLTNETLFSLTELPRRFGIIGSGPIGSEMAQTFARLGSEVFLFERSDRILSREDPQASAVLQREFERDGVRMMLNSQDLSVSNGTEGNSIAIQVHRNGTTETVEVDQLLVAVGRAPNIEGLGLETVGVQFDNGRVHVDDHLQTANPKIFAAGDVCSNYKFTHAADFMARIVIQNALFAVGPFGRRRASNLIVPWATYTSPEVAHVGVYGHQQEMLTKDAQRPIEPEEVDTYTQEFAHVDRAMLEGKDQGFIKIHTRKGTDKIVGATVVADNAGDLISEITLAMQHGIGLSKIAGTIHPYPTQAEAIRKVGDQFNRTKLTPTSRWILNCLRTFNVGK